MQESDFVQQSSNITLGRYHLLRCIGRGGMGEVWLAEDPLLRRQVAIKSLPAHNQDDHEYSRRFEREAQAAAALTHPHILPVHSYGEQPRSDGQIVTYIVMPYIGGWIARRAHHNVYKPEDDDATAGGHHLSVAAKQPASRRVSTKRGNDGERAAARSARQSSP